MKRDTRWKTSQINAARTLEKITVMDLHRRFNSALKDTVDEWKTHKEVKGIFTYGSYVSGTATMNSDLDICLLWEGSEAPTQLIAEHKDVRIDMTFLTPNDVTAVFEGEQTDYFRTAEVITRFRNARVEHDSKGRLKKWLQRAKEFSWSEDTIELVREKAHTALKRAQTNLNDDDTVSAIYEMRQALFNIGRVILMSNDIFSVIKPSEILNEIRMLDPMVYQLFLRSFKLKGMEEDELTEALEIIQKWLKVAVDRFEDNPDDSIDEKTTSLLTQAQRDFYGSERLTYNGEYELAVLEMRRAISMIGKSLMALRGVYEIEGVGLITQLREEEHEFYEQILMCYGAYKFPREAVQRSVKEAEFIAQRI
jgi:hypothetical protein